MLIEPTRNEEQRLSEQSGGSPDDRRPGGQSRPEDAADFVRHCNAVTGGEAKDRHAGGELKHGGGNSRNSTNAIHSLYVFEPRPRADVLSLLGMAWAFQT